MKARVRKRGNDLVLRIPQPLANQIGLEPDSTVELSLRGKVLVIETVTRPGLSLEELLARVTKDNQHTEVDTGSPTGREVW